MDYTSTLDSIKETFDNSSKKPLDYQARGRSFEDLINKICKDEKILLQESYHTIDNKSQQIDGAIEIDGHIFLLETKWASSSSLAASDYYSFLGKIYSKLDGTLGIFISYNDLRENFHNSIRNGIQQKCIVIHGEESINDIISGKVCLKEFILWLFRKASVDNIISKSTSDYLSDSTILIKSCTKNNTNIVSKIASSLIDEQKDVTVLTQEIGTEYTILVDNFEYYINCYINHPRKAIILDKIKYIIDCAFQENDKKAIEKIKALYSGCNWIKYSTEELCGIFSEKINQIEPQLSYDEKIQHIIEIAENYLIKNDDNWEEENKASRVINLFYKVLPIDVKEMLGEAFYNIYIDSYRKSHFAQKQMASKIFTDRTINKQRIAEKVIKRALKTRKSCQNLYNEKEEYIINDIAYRLKASEMGISDESIKQWYDEN